MARPRSDKSVQAIASSLEKAEQALAAGEPFAAQAVASEAVRLSHQTRDFGRMARAVELLGAARQDIQRAATKSRRVTIIEDEVPGGAEIKPGCYLVQPPRVGVDGRALRELATAAGVPAVVIVREPTTRTGLWPVVALGPVTIRARVKPPAGGKSAKAVPKPTPAWVQTAIEALAQAALETVPESPAAARVDALVERLGSIPESPTLHEALRDACLAAADEVAAASGKPLTS